MITTHTSKTLTVDTVGESVCLGGWLDTVRDHGGVLFLDLRDAHGTTQIVLRDDQMLGGAAKESVLAVNGVVRERDPDTVNPKISTGTLEVVAETIEILGANVRPLPFDIAAAGDTREDLRLQYRFLDLRNPALHQRIVRRAEIIRHMRRKMEDFGFVEIQTPILTASSPEGARDYLVPSRKHHGKFYALPQAPQQFKQLLMTAGFDKYFQIAPCFRDEDARADRSPGEFYQLDFEIAFADQEDVLQVGEQLLHDTFSVFSTKKVSTLPFPRIPYKDAMLRYGTDKPDMRNPLLIDDLTAFFADVDFAPFRGKPVRGIAVSKAAKQPKSFFEKMLKFATDIGMKGLGYISVLEDGALKGPIVKFLSEAQQAALCKAEHLQPDDTLFFISDTAALVDGLAGQIRTRLGEVLELIDHDRFMFCYIIDFPMYELDDETGAPKFTHNPFSMPQGGMTALETEDPLDVLAYQYDIVCNGIELSSGAVRNHLPEVMKKAFSIAGYGEDVLAGKFPALYNAFHYGAPPHAGMAPGIDRILMLLTEQENIREVIAFPMNASAQDVLLGAPGEVTEQQLREVHIKVR